MFIFLYHSKGQYRDWSFLVSGTIFFFSSPKSDLTKEKKILEIILNWNAGFMQNLVRIF